MSYPNDELAVLNVEKTSGYLGTINPQAGYLG
jgi:hypothetical protein